MNPPILSIWEHESTTLSSTKIIPDGCRDLLFWAKPGQRPYWTITSLDEQPYDAQMEGGTFLKGYRLQPGTLINTIGLLKSVQSLDCNAQWVNERINSFCNTSPALDEALAAIGAPDTKSVSNAAKNLGVSMRTLQRLIKASTGRTPAGWLSLSRARRAARQIPSTLNLAETAYDFGYSDQSHMTRELNAGLAQPHLKYRLIIQLPNN